MAPKILAMDLDLRAKEFANLTVAALLAFADRTGHELHIEFTKSAHGIDSDPPTPGPKKGRVTR